MARRRSFIFAICHRLQKQCLETALKFTLSYSTVSLGTSIDLKQHRGKEQIIHVAALKTPHIGSKYLLLKAVPNGFCAVNVIRQIKIGWYIQ